MCKIELYNLGQILAGRALTQKAPKGGFFETDWLVLVTRHLWCLEVIIAASGGGNE